MKLLIAASTAILLSASAFGAIQTPKQIQKNQENEIIRNWGIDNKEFSSHISAKKAWEITKGNKKIIVAVIDTGIDATHPALKDNLWKKPGTKDEYGFDFYLNKKNPEDSHHQGHGTHVAGIIGATAKAHSGAIGVAPNISIMAVRYYSEKASGSVNLANTVKAINYAIDNGANIINYSGGGPDFSAEEKRAIERAEAKGVLVVCAAGNEYENTDEKGHTYFPAGYDLSNIISVAATNIKNMIIPSSNWGMNHVHVAAPGENIFSTFPKGKYGYLTGTSQATAFVSGLAALILSENPKLKPTEVRKIIMDSADKSKELENRVASGGRINAYAALKLTIAKRKQDMSKVIKLASTAKPSTPTATTRPRKVAIQ